MSRPPGKWRWMVTPRREPSSPRSSFRERAATTTGDIEALQARARSLASTPVGTPKVGGSRQTHEPARGRTIAAPSGRPHPTDALSLRRENEVYSWRVHEWRGIDGFAWSPGSRAMALLNHSSRAGAWWEPWDLLGGLIGHPVAHKHVLPLGRGLEPAESVEYVIRSNVREGDAQVLDWSR